MPTITWIDVRDRLPEDRQRVLTWRPLGHPKYRLKVHQYEEGYSGSLDRWWIGDPNYLVDDQEISHWAVLPEGPDDAG